MKEKPPTTDKKHIQKIKHLEKYLKSDEAKQRVDRQKLQEYLKHLKTQL